MHFKDKSAVSSKILQLVSEFRQFFAGNLSLSSVKWREQPCQVEGFFSFLCIFPAFLLCRLARAGTINKNEPRDENFGFCAETRVPEDGDLSSWHCTWIIYRIFFNASLFTNTIRQFPRVPRCDIIKKILPRQRKHPQTRRHPLNPNENFSIHSKFSIVSGAPAE